MMAPRRSDRGHDAEVCARSDDTVEFLDRRGLLRSGYMHDGVCRDRTAERCIPEGEATNISQTAEVRLPQFPVGFLQGGKRDIDANSAPVEPGVCHMLAP